METPLGPVALVTQDARLCAITWGTQADHGADPVLDEAARQLRAYFDGRLETFEVPLDLPGPGFRQDFLTALIAIPFGQTRTYGDLARDLGVSAQAIGQACGANPIPIIIPCHRVLGANGLGGFSARGGVETKVALLRHEGAASLLL